MEGNKAFSVVLKGFNYIPKVYSKNKAIKRKKNKSMFQHLKIFIKVQEKDETIIFNKVFVFKEIKNETDIMNWVAFDKAWLCIANNLPNTSFKGICEKYELINFTIIIK